MDANFACSCQIFQSTKARSASGSFHKKILKSVQIKFCYVSFKELQERGQEYLSVFTDALRMM